MIIFLPCQRGSYKGIINYFFSINREKLLKVEFSSNYSKQINPYYIISQHEDENHWSSENKENQWFEITFIKNKITLTDYTIKSHWDAKFYLKSWKLEGSIDPINWQELHRIENSNDLTQLSNKTYSITSIPKPYNHFRFTLIGPNSDSIMRVNRVEFFGFINPIKEHTCKHNIAKFAYTLYSYCFIISF